MICAKEKKGSNGRGIGSKSSSHSSVLTTFILAFGLRVSPRLFISHSFISCESDPNDLHKKPYEANFLRAIKPQLFRRKKAKDLIAFLVKFT